MRMCKTEGCGKQPSYGVTGTKSAQFCAQHATDGMVNVFSRKCKTEGCGKQPSFGVAGTKTSEYCAQHALDGIDVMNRRCKTEGRGKIPSFGVAGTKTGERCAQHALDVMVDVINRKCRTEGCSKMPSFGVAGTNTAEYCAQHAQHGMIDVKNIKCRFKGCGKRPSFGLVNISTAEYCPQHASFGVTSKTEYCARHTILNCSVEGCMGREISPHYSRKETFCNASPSDTKQRSVHPSGPPASALSGGTRGLRKRVDITSTVSKRAVSQTSASEVVTLPEIEDKKSPVTRDSSVKTEVELSL